MADGKAKNKIPLVLTKFCKKKFSQMKFSNLKMKYSFITRTKTQALVIKKNIYWLLSFCYTSPNKVICYVFCTPVSTSIYLKLKATCILKEK